MLGVARVARAEREGSEPAHRRDGDRHERGVERAVVARPDLRVVLEELRRDDAEAPLPAAGLDLLERRAALDTLTVKAASLNRSNLTCRSCHSVFAADARSQGYTELSLRNLLHLLADLSLGVGLSLALRAFATGPDEACIAALVATSARFGSPLAHLLVLQADALRETERHSAEAKARRMPILMLFPLALCILPALLLVFLGPPLLSLLQ